MDPDTDRAVFSARDSFMAWETLHCLAPHIEAIKGSAWWNDDGDINIPLSIAEIKTASAAVGRFLRDYDDRTRRFRLRNGEHTPAGRVVRAEFISKVVAPTLRYPTDDLPHYGGFVSRLRELHALCREMADDDMRLFSGEGAEASSAEA